ncbi:MAG: PQQ-binding-like beta-propeller repeat protein [Planctomycetia bacterium]|nr:PQQ-binding-like beta-propeller repeat protein [Planctomycetia bacterium]
MWIWNLVALVGLLGVAGACAAGDELPADAAPADAWPMARGCLAGTGRSAGTLQLPLAESWHREFETTSFAAVPVIAAGTLFVGDLDGTFHALAVNTGEDRWSFKADEAGFPSAAAVAGDGPDRIVVVGDDTGLVRGFAAMTGEVRWTYETEGEISGGPTILPTADGIRVLVGSQDASLSCLNLVDGKLLWKHSIADQIRCSPTVARTAAGDRVFLAGCDGRLHVIDAATGNETAAVPIDGPTGTTPAVAGDRVFFGTEGGAFFAIDFAKGEVAWRKQPAVAGQSYRSSAALADDLAIVGFRGKAVEAFAVSDGDRRWRQPMRGRVEASPVVVSASGPDAAVARDVALVADAAGRIVALDAATGEPVWEFDAGGGFGAGAAVADGRVVIASDDGTIWCFQSGNP